LIWFPTKKVSSKISKSVSSLLLWLVIHWKNFMLLLALNNTSFVVFILKKLLPYVYNGGISRPIPPAFSVAGRDDTTRPRRQGKYINCNIL
jgi:hypothetical protein